MRLRKSQRSALNRTQQAFALKTSFIEISFERGNCSPLLLNRYPRFSAARFATLARSPQLDTVQISVQRAPCPALKLETLRACPAFSRRRLFAAPKVNRRIRIGARMSRPAGAAAA